MFEEPMKGKAWVFGDNLDTDSIYPGRYLHILEPSKMAEHAFEFVKADFAVKVEAGDIIIAGRNFGCGSSREHAVHCLKQNGVAAVVALSFARIFYRNAVNCALPVLTFDITEDEQVTITNSLNDGDEVKLNFSENKLELCSQTLALKINPLPSHLRKIINAGGLIELLKAEKTI